jgi:uncharacterized RDD family membrane protein YckC
LLTVSENLEPYRTFWRRFWAGWIDSALFMPVYWVDRAVWDNAPPVVLLVAWWLFNACSYTAYSVLCHGFFGQTLGKRLMRVKVYDVGGGPLSMWQALLRDSVFLALLSFELALEIPHVLAGKDPLDVDAPMNAAMWIGVYGLLAWFLLELVTMLFNPRRRAVHDFIAGSVVKRTT